MLAPSEEEKSLRRQVEAHGNLHRSRDKPQPTLLHILQLYVVHEVQPHQHKVGVSVVIGIKLVVGEHLDRRVDRGDPDLDRHLEELADRLEAHD